MWKMLFLVWSIPIAFGLVMVARLAQGDSAVDDNTWRLFFGEAKDLTLSPWVALKFLLFAIIFFGLGLFESLVLFNFGGFWVVVAPLMTGLAAILLLAHWVRSAPCEERMPRRKHTQWHATATYLFHLFSRLPARLKEKS